MASVPPILAEWSAAAAWLCLLFPLAVILCINQGLQMARFTKLGRKQEELEAIIDKQRTERRRLQDIERRLRNDRRMLLEVLNAGPVDRAAHCLLRQLVPDPAANLAVLFDARGETAGGVRTVEIIRAVGLSKNSRENFAIDEHLLLRLQGGPTCVLLEEADLRGSRLAGGLSRAEMQTLHRAWLVPFGRSEEPTGALLLAGSRFESEEDVLIEGMVPAVLEHLAVRWREGDSLIEVKDQLHSSNVLLELRRIADESRDSLPKMLQQFLEVLGSAIDARNAALFLIENDRPLHCPDRAAARGIADRIPSVDAQFRRHEHRLAEAALLGRGTEEFTGRAMSQLGIDTLVRSAFCVPLEDRERTIGILCLTRSTPSSFKTPEKNISKWAARFLTNQLLAMSTQKAVERRASIDGLTGLANRGTWDDVVPSIIGETIEQGSECSVILLDLDHFKSINDRFGHQAGDEVLRRFSAAIGEQLEQTRAEDRAIAARYGGEEFAIVLPKMPIGGAIRVAESIRQSLADLSFDFDGMSHQVTASLGIACCPSHGTSSFDLIAAADEALYRAKSQGRNRVACADSRELVSG